MKNDMDVLFKLRWHLLICVLSLTSISQVVAETYDQTFLKVTDKSGRVETIAYVNQFSRKSPQMYMGNYLELAIDASPAQRKWIHFSQATMVELRSTPGRLIADVNLANGKVLTGTILDPLLEISGNGDFGYVTYKIGDLRKIEVLGCARRDSPMKQRTQCASEWIASWKGTPSWTVSDRDTITVRPGLFIRDCYTSQGSKHGFDKRQVSASDQYLDVSDGTSPMTVKIEEISAITLTGRLVAGGPEIQLTNKAGKSRTFTWLPKNSQNSAGVIDDDDMLVWQTDFGFEGVSLLPLRPITMTRK